MFFGYFHSALGFSFTLLTLAAVLTGTWLWLRRGVGLLAAFPPGFGAQVWATRGDHRVCVLHVQVAGTRAPRRWARCSAITAADLGVWAPG